MGLSVGEVEKYVKSLGYEFYKLPNGRYLWRDARNGSGWGPVIISGENVTCNPTTYRRIEAIAGCSLLFVTNNCYDLVENTRDYDHDDYYIEKYTHTELKLVDAEGREVYLGAIGETPKGIKSMNIEGGVSLEVRYEMLELKSGYIDKYNRVRYYVAYDVYYQEGKDYVEVVEKRRKGIGYSYDETNAYRLCFATGQRERIESTAINKTLKPSGQ